jgi:hypothetical protein
MSFLLVFIALTVFDRLFVVQVKCLLEDALISIEYLLLSRHICAISYLLSYTVIQLSVYRHLFIVCTIQERRYEYSCTTTTVQVIQEDVRFFLANCIKYDSNLTQYPKS